MEVMRLIVTGPTGAGKSTFIRSISELSGVATDYPATNDSAQVKPNTPATTDFGRLQFNPQMRLHLYKTPRQPRFDIVWDTLMRKAHASILLVPAHQPAAFRQAKLILHFMSQRTRAPMIIGLTHLDCYKAWSRDSVIHALGFNTPQMQPLVVPVNANYKQSVSQAVITLMRVLAKQMRSEKPHQEIGLSSKVAADRREILAA